MTGGYGQGPAASGQGPAASGQPRRCAGHQAALYAATAPGSASGAMVTVSTASRLALAVTSSQDRRLVTCQAVVDFPIVQEIPRRLPLAAAQSDQSVRPPAPVTSSGQGRSVGTLSPIRSMASPGKPAAARSGSVPSGATHSINAFGAAAFTVAATFAAAALAWAGSTPSGVVRRTTDGLVDTVRSVVPNAVQACVPVPRPSASRSAPASVSGASTTSCAPKAAAWVHIGAVAARAAVSAVSIRSRNASGARPRAFAAAAATVRSLLGAVTPLAQPAAAVASAEAIAVGAGLGASAATGVGTGRDTAGPRTGAALAGEVGSAATSDALGAAAELPDRDGVEAVSVAVGAWAVVALVVELAGAVVVWAGEVAGAVVVWAAEVVGADAVAVGVVVAGAVVVVGAVLAVAGAVRAGADGAAVGGFAGAGRAGGFAGACASVCAGGRRDGWGAVVVVRLGIGVGAASPLGAAGPGAGVVGATEALSGGVGAGTGMVVVARGGVGECGAVGAGGIAAGVVVAEASREGGALSVASPGPRGPASVTVRPWSSWAAWTEGWAAVGGALVAARVGPLGRVGVACPGAGVALDDACCGVPECAGAGCVIWDNVSRTVPGWLGADEAEGRVGGLVAVVAFRVEGAAVAAEVGLGRDSPHDVVGPLWGRPVDSPRGGSTPDSADSPPSFGCGAVVGAAGAASTMICIGVSPCGGTMVTVCRSAVGSEGDEGRAGADDPAVQPWPSASCLAGVVARASGSRGAAGFVGPWGVTDSAGRVWLGTCPGVGGADVVVWAVGDTPGAVAGAVAPVAGGEGARVGCGVGAGAGRCGGGGGVASTRTLPSGVGVAGVCGWPGVGCAGCAGTDTVCCGAFGRADDQGWLGWGWSVDHSGSGCRGQVGCSEEWGGALR